MNTQSMLKVNHDELLQILNQFFKVKKSLFVFGGIGVGKSTTIYRFAENKAKELGKKFIDWNRITEKEKYELLSKSDLSDYFIFADVRLGTITEPSDLIGLPFRDDGGVRFLYKNVWRVLSREKNAYGVLFFDEMNQANELVQFASYQIVLDRRVWDLPLSDNVLIVGAGNFEHEVSQVFEISNALKDRFAFVELVVDVDRWVEWAFKNNLDSRIIAYISSNPSKLYIFDEKLHKPITPRDYHFASELIKGVENEDLQYKLLSSQLNTVIAQEIIAFNKIMNKYNLKDFVSGKMKYDDLELDELYLLIVMLSEKYKTNEKEGTKLFVDFLNNVALQDKIKPEFSTLALRLVVSIDKQFIRKIEKVDKKIVSKILNKFGKYLV